ncbi:hypothetical protein [Stenotrophomonas sp.]|uniref:hypothetical protein n=1 Tax=Stenotrophomonas sp. TaxID=69392 RepID=UPI0028AFF3DD|nr:hypothetical protein [Stenotrophomonas sp.]
MKMTKSLVRLSRNPALRYKSRRTQEPLAPVRLFLSDAPGHAWREVLAAVPWGLLVPSEIVLDGGSCSVWIDTQSTPSGSTFHLRIEVEGGDQHEESVEFVGIEPDVAFFLPQEWMLAAIGKQMKVDYDVEWPDGTRVPGPGTSFRVHPPLEIAPLQIEGVGYGEPMDPALLPEKIKLTMDRIRNLESFHEPLLLIMVFAGWDGHANPVLTVNVPLDTVGDGAQIVEIPRSYLTQPFEDGYTKVFVSFLLNVTMLPPPNEEGDWGTYIALGRNDVVPPAKT